MIRTRFAPSPTGFLHIGGARTALFAWLYARHHGGKFVLRIEDTDKQRSTQDSVQAIFDGLEWLGIDYDEGPFFQSERLERYHEVAEYLLKHNHAYYCYCTEEELATLRNEQIQRNEKPRYNRLCRTRTKPRANVAPVLRFKTPTEGSVSFTDQVYGDITVQNNELDDLVLLRSDGIPTYNFSVIVDDMDMKITHVIRGDDHINNTPRQIHLLRAIGEATPTYAHVPMILGADGKRLSKRAGAASVTEYRNDGYIPHAVCNYLVRLGWSHGDQEIFEREEMIRYFDLQHVGKTAASLNSEKLDWLNRHYLQSQESSSLIGLFIEHLKKIGYPDRDEQVIERAFEVLRTRHNNLREMAENAQFIYAVPTFSDKAGKILTPDRKPWLDALYMQLSARSDWTKEEIKASLDQILVDFGIALKQLGPAVRFSLTGGAASPDLVTTMLLIGREHSLQRLHSAVEFIKSSAASLG